MSSLTLQFENRVLKEYSVGSVITIGRLPDNSVVIDNPAVSGHHARVLREGDRVIVEDLQSTNGTFVNEKRVSRQTLRNGDVVIVGKHKLIFNENGASASAESTASREAKLSNLGDTMYLDTQQHRALLSKLNDSPAAAAAPPAKLGLLRVIGGHTDQDEYSLEAATSVIGAGDACLIRLKGWFKPKAAVAITRKGDKYSATKLGGSAHVNGNPIDGRYDLQEGDVLRVSGLTLQFRMKES